MIDQPVVICMKCHKDAIKREGQPTIAAVPEVIDPHTQKHGPIKEGLCSGCHDVHGSDQPAMLAKVYNKTFYQRFSPEHYELCFSCHDAKLVSEEQTSQSTAFRNGTRNLHYIHANTGDRDKSCSVCHSSHGSLNSRILRDRVVFGTWNMPIRYKKTPTGGSCYPGCHPTWAYDRVHPATRPTTAPTQPVKIAIARAEIEKPRRIQWAGRTISHDEVRVPDAKDPTILLFLGGELDQAKQSIDAIEQVRGDSLPARAIVLLCGPGAQSAEHEMLVPKTWETVADPDFAISREFNVVGWPMTMIVGTDGAEIIRIGGGAEALDARLHPYLELANKKIDAAALDARLSSHAASTPKTTKQMRDLQTARHLIESGKPAAACEILNELLKSEPEDVPLRVTMIQALTQSNRGLDALDMLNSLPADAMSLDERDLLRAKNQITLMRWDEAQRILTQTLARNPDCSEAHFIMGQIYEHANDWQHAAQEYRAMRAKQLPALNVAPAK
jgi:predicted CXXCH cytochrome family protein